jgi:hypothetical protein
MIKITRVHNERHANRTYVEKELEHRNKLSRKACAICKFISFRSTNNTEDSKPASAREHCGLMYVV